MQFILDSPALATARLHFRGQMILIFLYLLDWLLFVAGGIQVRDYNTDIRAALPPTAADFQGLARHTAMRPYWCFVAGSMPVGRLHRYPQPATRSQSLPSIAPQWLSDSILTIMRNPIRFVFYLSLQGSLLMMLCHSYCVSPTLRLHPHGRLCYSFCLRYIALTSNTVAFSINSASPYLSNSASTVAQ